MKGLEIKKEMKVWSKQIESIVSTFGERDIPEHAYMYHTHKSDQDLINRLLHEGKRYATTFDISMELVAEYIRKDLMDETERECFLYALLYNSSHNVKVYHDIWTDDIIGHGYSKSPSHNWKNGPMYCKNIGIYAVKDIHSRFGFSIISVYPIFGEEGEI
ncbi:hypothetical protein [Eubacterium sp. An3]|uniref:hypothetical protein n=1 Tax=Eubacterium sp. An3 TaxID=1965628 RepID=UPI000B389CAD|nr:hypothetical protein [Eubacterium sp. An3]OUO28450.1 hypothetical protein B5F87_06635 [Eubacterium sp. An3]